MSGDEPIGLTYPVIFAFVRIGTSARAFERPMSLAQATMHISAWIQRQMTRVLQPDAGHAQQVLELLASAASAGGNLVTDAQIAAVAIAYQGSVHTADRNFMPFKNLSSYYPLDQVA
jgi:predicted nucleic acid-binding protein